MVYILVLSLLPQMWKRARAKARQLPQTHAAAATRPMPRAKCSHMFVIVLATNVLLQILEFIFVSLSPSVFAAAFSSAVLSLRQYQGNASLALPWWSPGALYLVVHSWFVIDQHCTEHVKVRMLSATIMIAFDLVLMTCICVALILSIHSTGLDVTSILTILGPFGAISFGFLMAPTTLPAMLLHALPATLLLPTYNATFQSYALARLWDLRWGTRETTDRRVRAEVNELKAKVLDFNFVVLLVRILAYAGIVASRGSVVRNTAIAIATRGPSMLLCPAALCFIVKYWVQRLVSCCTRPTPTVDDTVYPTDHLVADLVLQNLNPPFGLRRFSPLFRSRPSPGLLHRTVASPPPATVAGAGASPQRTLDFSMFV
mmetsp:Transcript_51294/g.111527  ORF Transcript_51294/g.111527 Transcript_51294/m.111527 type:complete len:373 (-) Transcript_51294:47-1165(-)